jgi:hypothetical protein
MYLCFRTTSFLVSASPNISGLKFVLTPSKWTLSVMVEHFATLQSGQTTVPTSLVPLNCLLSQPTGSPLFLSPSHSGIVAIVTMILQTSAKSDIVCKPCLAGKMHSNPFPSSPSCATQPLELVHTDLHGHLPVATREGNCYWMTFIDNASSHQAAMQLKRKSNAFKAFKIYKAFAENHFQTKMKELQRSTSSLNVLNLMNVFFLALPSTLQHHNYHCISSSFHKF